MAYTGPAYPKWLSTEYPGLEGINTGLTGFNYLLNDPGFKQLAESQASDPAGAEFQGNPSTPAAFGRLMAGQMGADVAGQAAQDAGRTAAQKARSALGQNAADLMAGQQSSELNVEKAQTEQAGQELGGFAGILNTLTNPKGLGANIMSTFGGPSNQSPIGALFSGITSMFGGGSSPLFGGADLLASSGSDLEAALGGAPGAGGGADLFSTLLEAAPALAAA